MAVTEKKRGTRQNTHLDPGVQASLQRQATRPGLTVRGACSSARAWRPAFGLASIVVGHSGASTTKAHFWLHPSNTSCNHRAD
jgi:hypothetical protein